LTRLVRHVKYTIPPAVLLSVLYRPLQTRLDTYRIVFLLAVSSTVLFQSTPTKIRQIAVLATIPWDSYLVVNNVWTYPDDAVTGLKLFRIPVEELFFFCIQTYTTTLIYLLVNKSTVHVAYLVEINDSARAKIKNLRIAGAIGAVVMARGIYKAAELVQIGGKGTYMGLLGVWAGPFLLLLWLVSYRHILSLPMRNTLVPALLPTVYLWGVDTLALQRGTWAITPGTKLNYQPWPHMDIEYVHLFYSPHIY
jgi:15-cis-phytoene synthase/lycopene beta-cyclase